MEDENLITLLHKAAEILEKRKNRRPHPFKKGPGRPRGPELKRVDDEQEFIDKTGKKVKVTCLPRETRCKTKDHVGRIVEASHRLRKNNVKVTVKHIRMMGIGAGTFAEHKLSLPDDIKEELLLSARTRYENKRTQQEDSDEKSELSSDVDADDDITDLESQTFIEGCGMYKYEASHPALLAFDGVRKSKELDTLLQDENFRNAVLLVDGNINFIPIIGRGEAVSLASPFVPEVKRQRELHCLPVVNMRQVVTPPRPLMAQAGVSHKNIF